MSMFPGDVLIRQCITLGLEDIRKNSWIIDDIFSDFITNPLLTKKYGQSEINNARDYILNNNIPVIMGLRLDKEEVPCVTIAVGTSQEADDLATLGDMSTEIDELSPDQISKPIKFIVPPFKIDSYDNNTGLVTVESADISLVRDGMVAINPKNGSGYIIQSVNSDKTFSLEPGLNIKVKELAIVPQYQVYRARRERASFREVYSIGCHSHGDPSTLIFLHGVVMYILLRYRESLLEGENFALTSISSSDMMQNQSFQTINENVYSRFITLKGITENTWLKTPTRVIEAISTTNNLGEIGIKIISKKQITKDEDPVWVTIDE